MPSTHAATLAKRYLDLGGQRRSIIDDNIISTRLWDDEPAAAAGFWSREIDTLPDDLRDEVESLLPSINADKR